MTKNTIKSDQNYNFNLQMNLHTNLGININFIQSC